MKHLLIALISIISLLGTACDRASPAFVTVTNNQTVNATITANNQTIILPAGNITIIIIAGNTTGNITW